MSDDVAEPPRATPSSGAATKLFQANRPSPAALPAVVEFVAALIASLSAGFRDVTTFDADFVLDALTREAVTDFQILDEGVVNASAFIPQWSAYVLITYDRRLLFRVLDVMFGGDPARLTSAPHRALTELETSLVILLTETLLEAIKSAVIGCSAITFAEVSCSEPGLGDAPVNATGEVVVVRLRAPEFGDELRIALPAIAMDLVTDRTSTAVARDTPELDPRWAQDLRQTLVCTSLSLVAVAHAQSIPMGDVATLRPGSLLEFDGDCLNSVRLECADQVVWVGRLGQSKGRYTLCVETAEPLHRPLSGE